MASKHRCGVGLIAKCRSYARDPSKRYSEILTIERKRVNHILNYQNESWHSTQSS
jgi:hypothetical protein